ncbi:MAG: hypothetical protein UX62_C0058G0002 [Microgenomates group bacterium GW2011_GWA2_46_7]|nr:MAG: hypothetical protein UX62_C0058G0002 [Microgenomates group bacterium GW2011_GWA2_46_7]
MGIGTTEPLAPLDVSGDIYSSSGISTFRTAVSDGTIEATKFCTGDGETNCVTSFSSISTLWQRTSGSLAPLNITDSVNIGATATASAYVHLAGTSGENSFINTGNVGIGDTSPSKMFVVGNGDLFQVDSSGNIFGPTLALGTGTIARTDRLYDINTTTALTSGTTYTGTIQRTLSGTITGATSSYGLYNVLTVGATDGIYSHTATVENNTATLSSGNTIDTIRGSYTSVTINSATISPDPAAANTATTSAAVQGLAQNNAAGIISNQYGGIFDSYNNSSGSVVNQFGSYNRSYTAGDASSSVTTANGSRDITFTNVDGSTIGTAIGTYGAAYELTAQTTGGISSSYGGYFQGQDATTTHGLYAQGLHNTANTETFTNTYGVRSDCLSNSASVTITNCYGVSSSITETLGTITNGYAGYFTSAAAMTTSYGLYSNITGAGTTNYGLYTNISGASTNYAIYTNGTATSYFGGSVGIGITNPSQELTVSGDLYVTGGYYDSSGDIGSSGQLLSSTGTGTNWIAQNTVNFWQRNDGALSPDQLTNDVLTGATATASAFVRLPGLNNEDAFFNLGTGGVAIGLTTTTFGFEVNGTARINGDFTIGTGTEDAVTVNADAWTFANATTVALADVANSLNFDSDTLTIDALNERVGIGITNPSQKLQVAGNIVPSADDSYDLGTGPLSWRIIYLSDSIHDDAGTQVIDVQNNRLLEAAWTVRNAGDTTKDIVFDPFDTTSTITVGGGTGKIDVGTSMVSVTAIQ